MRFFGGMDLKELEKAANENNFAEIVQLLDVHGKTLPSVALG